MGTVEEKLIDQHEREGTPIPAKIANAPTLYAGLEFYFKAFQTLMKCRSIGMGVGPIPWTATLEYCREYELDDEMRDDMFFFIEQMDDVYVDYVSKQKPDKGKR